MNNLNQFLTYIHKNNKSIIKSHTSKGMRIINEVDVEVDNTDGDIYFVVNSGGDSDIMINNYNAVFIDLDCGKINRKFHPLDVVKSYKEKKIAEIKEFKLKPTFIVETRNGLHVYWVIKECSDEEVWKSCMLKLIDAFKGDKAVHNPSRLMRVPFTNWMKDKDNPFYIDLVEFNDVVYDIEAIVEVLKVETLGVTDRLSYKDTFLSVTPRNSKETYDNMHIKAIANKDTELLRYLIKPSPKKFYTQNDFYTHITQVIDLREFLGLQKGSFKCIYHDDHSPSAGIFVSDSRNQHFYKCHSDEKCGFMGNIIRCVERLQHCTRPKAINFIKEVYLLEIEESDWQKEQKKLLEENKRMIREGELEEYYPDVYKLIKNYTGLIYELHDIAIDNVYDEKNSDVSGNAIFFASLRLIADRLEKKSHRKISDRIGLIAFLSLLSKIPEKQIPSNYLSRAKHIAATMEQTNIVNFFSIPSYCDDLLSKSQERATMYVENNMTMKGWSKELLDRTFGEEIAKEIYPQFRGNAHGVKGSRTHDKTGDIHKIINQLIIEHGYASESQAIELLREEHSKTSVQIQMKKSLQEMLDAYGFERIRATKSIKEQYGIVAKGYPFIIVKK